MKNLAFTVLAAVFGISYALIIHVWLMDQWLGIYGAVGLSAILTALFSCLFIGISNKKIVAVIIAIIVLGYSIPGWALFISLISTMDDVKDESIKLDAVKRDTKKAKLEAEKSMYKLGCQDARLNREASSFRNISDFYLKGYNDCQ